MAHDQSPDIPGVEDKELETVAGFVPSIPNLRAAPADRFAQEVRTLLECRAQHGWPNEGEADVAVFVLVDYPRKFGERHGGKPFMDPLEQGTPLLGRVFFCSLDATHGQTIPLPTEANAISDWLRDAGLGERPLVMGYRNAKKMVTRRAGIDDFASRDEIREEEPTATLPEVFAALTHFHESRAITPRGCPPGVWKKGSANKYIPGSQPEKSIQYALEIALGSWFHGVVRAESEDTTNIGRIDVRLLKTGSDGTLGYWIILELKVIKSYTHPKDGVDAADVRDSTNVAAIVEGIKQAGSYRANRTAEEGMLEIYDLRKDKSIDLTEREEVSAALGMFPPAPRIDVWPLFGRAKDARDAGYTGF